MKTIIPHTQADEALPLDPKLQALLRRHFWCDFSDIIPSLTWDETDKPN